MIEVCPGRMSATGEVTCLRAIGAGGRVRVPMCNDAEACRPVLHNCLSCANRVKADAATWDTNGGDFWHCTAAIVLPEFCGVQLREWSVDRAVNLNLFLDPAPTAPGLNARTCPLWSDRA